MSAPKQTTGPDTRRARWSWRDTAVVGAIVALGIGAAWALPHDSTDSTAPEYVTEPVAYPVDIPGCDEVLPSPPPVTAASWRMYGASYGYDDPDFTWLTAAKATAMTEALLGTLPTDVEVLFDAPSRMLLFQPIFRINTDTLPDHVDPDDVTGKSDARGIVVRGGHTGTLYAAVRTWDRPPPPCVAGELDERRLLPDGTVVDVRDTWSELRGVRTLAAVATAYPPDGSRVIVTVDDEDGDAHSGALPLTVDELASIAADPGLRTTTPVPAGTAAARMGCGTGQNRQGRPLTRADVDRLGVALDTAWAALGPMPSPPDRPLGSLQLTDSTRTSVCTEVTLPGTTGDTRLRVTIAPALPPDTPPAGDLRPDGTRVHVTDEYGTTFVAVARPSGTTVTFSVDLLDAAPTVDQLITLATSPGLDL
ncbi:hypothetical protein [Rhodococcus sp. NPDC004095]